VLQATEGRRRALALASQAQSKVDAVLCMAPENIYYFTGFRTMLYTRFNAVLVRMDRPESPVLVVATVDRRLIEDRVWSPPWVSDIAYHGPDSTADVAPTPAAALAPYMRGVQRLGLDSISLSDLEEVRRAAPEADVVQVFDLIDGVRQIKSEQEIEHLRQANKLAMQGMEHARGMLEAGPTTELEIAVQLEAEARLAGADGFGYPTLVSSGAKMGAVHSPALHRPVEPGKPLRVAFGPKYEGYCGDVVRTFCVGQPPAELVRLQDGFLEALGVLLGIVQAGVAVPEMIAKVRAVYEKRGLMGYWRNSIGHGLGLTIHESPRIAGASRSVLAENMVVALEPALTVSGFGGYGQCDIVLITRTGNELLTSGPGGIIAARA